MFRSHREEGSLVIALLASIIVGGLAVALVGTTMTGQKKVQHDRDFQLAINGAEAGVNDALTRITAIKAEDALSTTSLSGNGALSDGGIGYDWIAEKDTLISWRITGTGTRNGSSRTIEALAIRDAIFFMAAFADIGIGFKGGNIVQSYSATTLDTDSGNGAAGSNGAIYTIGNGSSNVDIVMLMGSGATCSGNVCTSAEIIGFSSAFDLDKIAKNIEGAMESCNGSFSAYDAATGPTLEGGKTYCFSDVKVGGHGQLPLINQSRTNPVRILMTGTFSSGNQSKINCGSGCDVTKFPDAAALQIYSLGPAVLLGNHSQISAAIAAPYATCKGNPSVAQADIYGAIICNDMDTQGGWNFYFDDRLLDLGSGQYEIKEWREEVGGSTSWPD
jgi:hypothetical protein